MNENSSKIDKAKRYDEVSQKYGDPWLWGIYFTIIVFSVIETYSGSSREVAQYGVYVPLIKHCLFLVLGFVALMVCVRIPYNNKTFMASYTVGLFFFTLAALVYVLFFGEVINHAQRAIRIAGFTFQPAEFAKFSTVTMLAYILPRFQRKQDVSPKGIACSIVVVAIFGVLMFKSSLTNFILIAVVAVVMMITGGISRKKILISSVAILCFGIIFLMIKTSNDKQDDIIREAQESRSANESNAVFVSQVEEGSGVLEGFGRSREVERGQMRGNRIKDWWAMLTCTNIDSIPVTPGNSQVMFSRMAQAHGGITGVFFGNSREASRLPLAFSDYIYSIIVEDTGLIGGTIILFLYIGILLRAAMIARRCRRMMPALLVIGCASMITLQALCHIAINTGVFPVSGQPLPLISSGGTSIIVMSIAFGFMLSISRTVASFSDKQNIKKEEEDLPENLRAENPSQINFINEWK